MTPDETQLTPEQEERAFITIQRTRANFLGFLGSLHQSRVPQSQQMLRRP